MRHHRQRSIILTIRQEELPTAGKVVLHVRTVRTSNNSFSVQPILELGTKPEQHHQERYQGKIWCKLPDHGQSISEWTEHTRSFHVPALQY